jgi:hypothetical protein
MGRLTTWARLTWAGLSCIALVATVAPASAEPDASAPGRVSEKIVADLARADLEATAADSAKYLGQNSANNLKNSFASIKNLGQSQYSELVYSRDYGKTGRDMIYKIDFEKAFAFVRFVWHIDNGDWHLVHLQYKTENDLPFPSGWEHIYPK